MLGSLRVRIALAYVVLIVASFAGLGLYVLDRVENDFRDSIRNDLAAQARMIANVAAPQLDPAANQEDLDALADRLGAAGDTRITIIAADGTVLGDSQADPATMENHGDRPEVAAALRTGFGTSDRHSETVASDLTYVAVRFGSEDGTLGVVRVARPSAALNDSLANITRSLLIAVLAAAAAAVLLAIVIGQAIVRPLERLARAANVIAAGNLRERVSPRPPGEIGQLADAFNTMAGDLEALITAASQERNRLAAALNSSIDAVLAVDASGRLSFANRAAERLFARSQEELLHNPFVWIMPNEQAVEAVRASREEARRSSLFIERPNRRYLQLITTPIVGGGDWAALVVFHDLTDMRRVEQVRRDFVANVSHELRTPLASIKSVIETLLGGALDDPAAARDFLSRADTEVDRLVTIVEELLELSRIESGEVPIAREQVHIPAVLANAVERLRPQSERQGLDLSLDVSPDLPPVTGDAERLERVVINLLHNAIKFTPSGGAVRVSAKLGDGGVSVSVTDTGVGIPPDKLSRVFERFYKADRSRGGGGTGLGLAVVKHIVEAHGGTVSANSEPDRGTTFTFTIPAPAMPLKS